MESCALSLSGRAGLSSHGAMRISEQRAHLHYIFSHCEAGMRRIIKKMVGFNKLCPIANRILCIITNSNKNCFRDGTSTTDGL